MNPTTIFSDIHTNLPALEAVRLMNPALIVNGLLQIYPSEPKQAIQSIVADEMISQFFRMQGSYNLRM